MKNKALFSIILVVFIDLLGFSLILPLLPYYAETFRAYADRHRPAGCILRCRAVGRSSCAGSPLRSLRTTSHPDGLRIRHVPRVPAARLCERSVDALCQPGHRWLDGRQPIDRPGLHYRCDRCERSGAGPWTDRRGLRPGIHHWAGRGRVAKPVGLCRASLRGRDTGSHQPDLDLRLASEFAAGRATKPGASEPACHKPCRTPDGTSSAPSQDRCSSPVSSSAWPLPSSRPYPRCMP